MGLGDNPMLDGLDIANLRDAVDALNRAIRETGRLVQELINHTRNIAQHTSGLPQMQRDMAALRAAWTSENTNGRDEHPAPRHPTEDDRDPRDR